MHFISMSQSATHSELFPFEKLLNSFLALPILQFSFDQKLLSHDVGHIVFMLQSLRNCTARQCSPLRRKFMELLYKQSSSIAFDETSSYWSAPKNYSFLGFSLVTTR